MAGEVVDWVRKGEKEALEAGGVVVPNYDRKRATPSIAHVGVGGFHRAHMAVYLDDLLRQGLCDWSIVGIGLKEPFDRRMRDSLKAQDCYYTVVECDGSQRRARIIGSIADILFAPEAPEEVLAVLSRPELRIVSLTITEGGYFLDGDGKFSGETAEATKQDLEHDRLHPERPRTVFGFIVEALRRRHRAGLHPFTVLSCDNIQGNGDVTRSTTLGFARVLCRDEPELLSWIEDRVAFPNSMVDRITPATTEEDKALLKSQFGIDDLWPVTTEGFRQWIIEDHFGPGGRPPFELVGAQFVEDVTPYESMKLRILNAGHLGVAYLAYLVGYRLVHEAASDPTFSSFLEDILDKEVTDLLPPVPGIDLTDYKRTVLQRFRNPAVRDQLLRLCSFGSAKIPKFILPTVTAHLHTYGTVPPGLTLIVSSYFRYIEGLDEEGKSIPIEDEMTELVQSHTKRWKESPDSRLELPRKIFGELADSAPFVRAVEEGLRQLQTLGARKTLEQHIASRRG